MVRPASGGCQPPEECPELGGLTPSARRVFVFFAFAITLIPLFAHGCHTGDHDDEPLFVPRVHNWETPP